MVEIVLKHYPNFFFYHVNVLTDLNWCNYINLLKRKFDFWYCLTMFPSCLKFQCFYIVYVLSLIITNNVLRHLKITLYKREINAIWFSAFNINVALQFSNYFPTDINSIKTIVHFSTVTPFISRFASCLGLL